MRYHAVSSILILLSQTSCDKHVDTDSSPAFIVHTTDDQVVDVRNTLDLARAYSDAGVKYELHIYPTGPHGMALGNEITSMGKEAFVKPDFAEWVRLAAAWAERLCENKN